MKSWTNWLKNCGLLIRLRLIKWAPELCTVLRACHSNFRIIAFFGHGCVFNWKLPTIEFSPYLNSCKCSFCSFSFHVLISFKYILFYNHESSNDLRVFKSLCLQTFFCLGTDSGKLCFTQTICPSMSWKANSTHRPAPCHPTPLTVYFTQVDCAGKMFLCCVVSHNVCATALPKSVILLLLLLLPDLREQIQSPLERPLHY